MVPVERDNRFQGTPLLVSGQLRWSGEPDGLMIPTQPLPANRPFLVVPITDEQIARIESKRAGGQATFDLALSAIGIVSNSTWILSPSFAPPVVVPRDDWLKVLEQLGAGSRRIVELPAPPQAQGPKWADASGRIEAASWRLSSGDPGGAMSETRTAYERLLEALGDELGRSRLEKEPLKNFAEAIASVAEAGHTDRSDDAMAVLAGAIRLAATTFAFASHPVHRGLDTTERINAELALQTVTALYTYLARVALGGSDLGITKRA